MKGQLTWIEVQDSIGWIKINREKKLNALNQELIDELHNRIIDFQKHHSVKVIVLTGKGNKAFVAGADISEFSSFKPEQAAEFARHGNQVLFDLITQLEKPVIAAINGYALGGGAELALACDFRVFERHAFMSFKQTQVGLTTGWTGGWCLVDLIGYSRALELALTGQKVSASRAHALGLCNIIADSNCGIDAAQEMLSLIARGAPTATAATKRVFQGARQSDLRTSMGVENDVFRRLWGAPDHVEALHAFHEKRRPKFQS